MTTLEGVEYRAVPRLPDSTVFERIAGSLAYTFHLDEVRSLSPEGVYLRRGCRSGVLYPDGMLVVGPVGGRVKVLRAPEGYNLAEWAVAVVAGDAVVFVAGRYLGRVSR